LEQDTQLVQQCLQGDGSAWEELVRRHSRRIFNICYRFTGNRTESEDLSQDVFLRVYRTLASYRSAHGGFATWMTSVTRNLLIDHYRRTKRDRITDSLDDAMPAVENKASSARRPDEQALLGELSGQAAFPRTARSGDFARLAATGLRGDPNSIGCAGRNCEIENQSRTYRTGSRPAANGSAAVMNGFVISKRARCMA
jgi:hypothetical protein